MYSAEYGQSRIINLNGTDDDRTAIVLCLLGQQPRVLLVCVCKRNKVETCLENKSVFKCLLSCIMINFSFSRTCRCSKKCRNLSADSFV